MDPVGRGKDGCPVLRVYVQTRATASRCCGLHSDALKLAVAAPPVDGKANRALIKFLAKRFNIHRREVLLLSGKHSRSKLIGFPNLTEEMVRERLQTLLC